MAVLVMPTAPANNAYTFRVSLEGVNYGFRFYWNTREGAWYFDLNDDAGEAIVSGQKLTADWPWLQNVVDRRAPPGDLVALDTTGGGEPERADLGQRIALLYSESSGT
jgi:hypothetical protein